MIIVFLDELFKANDGILNSLLTALNERVYTNEGQAVKIPVIGLGGICTPEDAVEFLMAGAKAIAIGTANFLNPAIAGEMAEGINRWLDKHGCKSVDEIIGVAQ